MSFSNHNHKTKPQGCKFCSTKLTKEKFINKANKIHNFKYDYSLIEDKITSTDKVTIICKTHKEFKIKASHHYNDGRGCKKCSLLTPGRKRSTVENTNMKLKNFKYTYELNDDFKNYHDKIKAFCKAHGVFNISIHHAIEGNGCPVCAIDHRKNNLTFSRTNFKKICIKNNNSKGIFYIIKCFNDNETFYKLRNHIKIYSRKI